MIVEVLKSKNKSGLVWQCNRIKMKLMDIFIFAVALQLLSFNSVSVWGRFDDEDHNSASDVAKYKTVSRLIREILLVKVPRCDLILVNDEYFRAWLVYWIASIGLPTYSLSLDLDLNYNFTTQNLVFKPSGFSQCSNIVVCCWSFSTCRSPNSPILYKMLADNGILKKERRSFLFIANLSTPKLYSTIWYENETASTSKSDLPYSLPEMNKAGQVLKELGSHVTLIQRYDPTRSPKSSNNYTVLQLMTWTINWVPGGTPVIPNIYSLDRKLWPTQHTSLKLSINDYRLGGTVKYCTSSKSLLPMILVDDMNKKSPPNLKGLDAEIITMFQRRFGLKLEFFEPGDAKFEKSNADAGGDFKGVISHVIEKNADFGIGQIAYSADRFQSDLQFSPGFFLLLGAVVCTIPDYAPKWKLMTLPFQANVWFATLVYFVISLLALHIVHKLGRRIHSEKGSSNFPWISFLGPSLQRSIPIDRISKKYSFLIGLGFWLFCCFLLSSCYSNILTGVLTFPPREKPIDSLRDLLSSHKTWSVTGLIDETISSRNGELESIAIDRAKELGLVSVSAYDKEAYTHAIETSGCLIAEKNRAQYMIATSFTKLVKNQPFALLRISKESFLLGPTGWAMRGDIDFTLQSYFDILFPTFRDFGLLDKTKRDISPKASRDIESREPSSLELQTIQVLFYFLIVAHLMSVFAFLGELLYFYYASKRNDELSLNVRTEITYPFIR